jgi:hypothetical protein
MKLSHFLLDIYKMRHTLTTELEIMIGCKKKLVLQLLSFTTLVEDWQESVLSI